MKKFFTWKEMQVTDSGKPNYPALSSCRRSSENLHDLIVVLSVLRGLINVPIHVNSAFRSPEVNSLVGGSINSLHLEGRAADITCKKLHELLDYCLKLKESKIFVEVIYYPDKNFIHVAI